MADFLAQMHFAAGVLVVSPHPAYFHLLLTTLSESSNFIIYFFLHAELSKINPEPWTSSGRGSRGGEQQALKSEALQPSQEVAVPSCERIVYSRCSKVLQLCSHFHLSPSLSSPSFPLSLFLSDASRKRKFMEVVPRAVFSALVLVGACSWLAQPSLLPALPKPPSPHTKDRSCYHSLAASWAPASRAG